VTNHLALGSAQLGLPYGIANTNGQVDFDTASSILHFAKSKGMDTIDTAISYGDSERCLGKVGVHDWRVITKLPEVPNTCADVALWVNEQVQGSLSRLKLERLSGLLLHSPNQLLDPIGKQLWLALQNLKRDKIVNKIGYSIYEPAQLDSLWSTFRPDLVQAPFNVLDRRLIRSGWLQRIYESDVEIHARSILLQGLLLMNEKNRPRKFNRWSDLWAAWAAWLQLNGLTALQACVAFAMAEPRINRIIVGVESLNQLEEILTSINTNISAFPEELNINNLDLINPSRWNSL